MRNVPRLLERNIVNIASSKPGMHRNEENNRKLPCAILELCGFTNLKLCMTFAPPQLTCSKLELKYKLELIKYEL